MNFAKYNKRTVQGASLVQQKDMRNTTAMRRQKRTVHGESLVQTKELAHKQQRNSLPPI